MSRCHHSIVYVFCRYGGMVSTTRKRSGPGARFAPWGLLLFKWKPTSDPRVGGRGQLLTHTNTHLHVQR